MEWLGKVIAIFLMLTAVSVLLAVLKAIGFWFTGKTKALPSKVDPTNSVTPSVLLAPEPLKPKDSRKKAETSEQSVFITKYKSPNKEILQFLTTKTCSIHDKKCIGLVIIDFLKPPATLDFTGEKEHMDGQLLIAICEECIPIAISLKHDEFTWKRKNYNDHPGWSSYFILPYLLYDRYARIRSVIEMSNTGKWVECANAECKPKEMKNNIISSSFSVTDIILSYSPYIQGEISAKKFKKAMNYVKLGPSEIPLVLIDMTVFGSAKDGILLTDTHMRIYDSNMRNSIAWKEIYSANCSANLGLIFDHTKLEYTQREPEINGQVIRPFFSKKSGLDYFVNMVNDIADKNPNRQELFSKNIRIAEHNIRKFDSKKEE